MTRAVTLDVLAEQLALADELLAGRDTMFEPQDLPGRYGRVIQTRSTCCKSSAPPRCSAADGSCGGTGSLGV